MIPLFPNFKKLEIIDKEEINNFVRPFPPSSEHSFASLYCWDTNSQVQISNLYGNLVIVLNDYLSNEKFLTFIGNKKSTETVGELFIYLKGHPDIKPELRLIIEDCFVGFDLNKQYSLTEDRDYFDYIYSLDDLANLTGNKYRGKRNFVNRFNRLYKYSIAEINLTDDQTWHQAQELYSLWNSRHVAEEGDVDNETIAIKRWRSIVNPENFYNLGIFSGGKMIGYAFNELNGNGYATNHFEHGDTDFVGIFPMLKSQTAQKLIEKGFTFLSHQEDVGLKKLRKSKMDWLPQSYLKKFTVRLLNSA